MIKKLIFRKSLSDLFILISFLLTLISFISYLTSGTNEFATELSIPLILIDIFVLLLQIVLIIFKFKSGKYLSFLLLFLALFLFTYTQITYIGNVFVSIDGNSFSAGFLLTMIGLIIAFVTSLVSAILEKDEKVIWEEIKNENHE